MARIKIDMPDHLLGSFKVPVRISDINYGNHLGNDAVVSIIHEARVQWLQSLGYTELNIGGVGLIMSDLAVQFRSEVFYGDTITVDLFTGERSTLGFELFYGLRNKENRLVANAKTGMVCFDYQVKKPAQVPAAFRVLLETKQQP